MRTADAVQTFLTLKMARGLSPETIRWYKGILYAFSGFCLDLPEIPEPILSFMAVCSKGDERRHGYYRALKAFYNYLDIRLHAFPNPMKFVEPPRRIKKYPRALTIDELRQLLEYDHPKKIKAALMFLTDTGARIGELSNLKLNDLSDTPFGYIAKITGKTGARLVPISYETFHELCITLPLNYTNYRLRRLIAMAFRNAKVPGTAHTLRHTFGTMWQGDELILQQIMGHAHLSTTRIYRHLRTEMLSQQHRQYSPLHMVLTQPRNMI